MEGMAHTGAASASAVSVSASVGLGSGSGSGSGSEGVQPFRLELEGVAEEGGGSSVAPTPVWSQPRPGGEEEEGRL